MIIFITFFVSAFTEEDQSRSGLTAGEASS